METISQSNNFFFYIAESYLLNTRIIDYSNPFRCKMLADDDTKTGQLLQTGEANNTIDRLPATESVSIPLHVFKNYI